MEKVVVMLDFSLLHRLYPWTREQLLNALIDTLKTQGSCVVNFLYFANGAKQCLFEWTPEEGQKKYADALQGSDFLLADGIALQLFCKRFIDTYPPSLNGTDLNPYLLEQLLKTHTVSMYLYQCYDPPKGKTVEFLQKGIEALKSRFPGLSVVWADQCLFREKWKDFDRVWLEKTLKNDNHEIKIFFNCTGTPFQEVWVKEHIQQLRDCGFLVLNAWWTIDYLTGYEKRSPQRVVQARVLETVWRITTQPKKNLKKFLRMFGFFRILAKKLLQLDIRWLFIRK
jgi:exopolysaccharide biosynthesis WecB/TagA/CpsF family protein